MKKSGKEWKRVEWGGSGRERKSAESMRSVGRSRTESDGMEECGEEWERMKESGNEWQLS